MVLGVGVIGQLFWETSDLLQGLLGTDQLDLGLACLAFDSTVQDRHDRHCIISCIPGAVVDNGNAQLRLLFFDGTGLMNGAISLTALNLGFSYCNYQDHLWWSAMAQFSLKHLKAFGMVPSS